METDSIFDKCCFFIEDKAIFGCFPTQDDVNKLESAGVRVFVNLTSPFEKKIGNYKTKYTSIGYQIPDKGIPRDVYSFYLFIKMLYDALTGLGIGEKMYIHCKGGHGRSGLVAACLLIFCYGISSFDALNHTYKCHQQRKTMRDIWRRIGSPQTQLQKNFVRVFETSVKNDIMRYR